MGGIGPLVLNHGEKYMGLDRRTQPFGNWPRSTQPR